jgi:chromosome segregation ATPase
MNILTIPRVVFVVIFCLLLTTSATSQSLKRNAAASPDEPSLLNDLLTEVHQLRLALQQSNLMGYRAQIALERIRMQQARVDRLTRQIEANESELATIGLSLPQIVERAKALEGEAKLEQNAEQRVQLEAEYRESKSAVDQQKEREVQLRALQAQLESQLQSEQLKLEDLNARLSQLEREMELHPQDTIQTLLRTSKKVTPGSDQ